MLLHNTSDNFHSLLYLPTFMLTWKYFQHLQCEITGKIFLMQRVKSYDNIDDHKYQHMKACAPVHAMF